MLGDSHLRTGETANLNRTFASYTDSVMGTWNFSYDTLNRLVSSQNTAASSATPQFAGNYGCWSYDAFGNRLSQAISTTPCAGTPPLTSWATYNASNQFTATSAAPGGVPYDPAGDVTNDGVNQYLYDGEGRICAVASTPIPGMTAMTGYLYDADGTRVAKGSITSWSCNPAVNGFQTTSDYILGPGGEQLTEMGVGFASSANSSNSALTWQHTNVYAAGSLLATYDNDGLHFYLNDPLGTRRAQTDYAGVLEQTCSSLPFGDGLSCSGGNLQAPTEHHFTGKERDAESGNDYFGARYYASSMGRFMSPDSPGFSHLSNPEAWNLYAYTYNNPITFRDPDGHDVALGTGSVGQLLADANKATNAGGRVYAIQTTTSHSFLGLFHYSSTETTLAIHGDVASFRALGQNASRLADLIENHSFTLTVNYGSYNPTGGSNSLMMSQGFKAPSVIIDPSRSGATYDPDAVDQNIPQANTAEEFGHEVLGHQWGELIAGHANAMIDSHGYPDFAPTTRSNMRDSISGENAVRALDPTRGQKDILSHHNYADAPSDGYKK
jgi:RHS repeat-associated protein